LQSRTAALENFIANIAKENVIQRTDCKFKNGTWSLNNSGNQSYRRQHGSQGNTSHVASVIESSQSKKEVDSQDASSSHGFSA